MDQDTSLWHTFLNVFEIGQVLIIILLNTAGVMQLLPYDSETAFEEIWYDLHRQKTFSDPRAHHKHWNFFREA